MVICGCDAVPDPVRLMESGVALFVIETLPVTLVAVVGAKVTVNVLVSPGLIVFGARPAMVKPVPVMVVAVIETGAVPELVKVTGTVAELPTRTFPKGMLAGLALRVPWVPVPLSEMEIVGSVALVVMVMIPDAGPAAVGANFADRDAVPPAAMVCPGVIPVTVKPGPLAEMVLTVIVVVPEFVNVMGWVLLLPTATLLKLKLPGVGVRVLPAAMALPVMVRVCGELGALSVKTMFPVAPVVEVGEN